MKEILRNHKSFIIGLVLFLLQIYLLFKGVELFGKYGNPVFLLLVSAIIPVYYLRLLLRPAAIESAGHRSRDFYLLAGVLLGALFLCGLWLRKSFHALPDPGHYSDVLPQLETLYNRFVEGQQPYYPVPLPWAPFPVYMPLHWLPIALSRVYPFDVRWVGYLLFACSLLLYGFLRYRRSGPIWKVIAVSLLPFLPFLAYLAWGGIDLGVSFEIIIAAYYLVLAAGLYYRKLWLVTFGILLCLLSRYTLVFWMPLFALLLLWNRPLKFSVMVWSLVILGVLLLYILPFYLKDPSILLHGVRYHNEAAIAEWHGYGEPPVSWTHENGIYFASHLKKWLPGDAAAQVFQMRILQGGLMLLLLGAGALGYRKIRDRIDFYDYALVMLYTCILLFYLFGPLTYRYYWISLFMISAVLCGNIMMHREPIKKSL